MSAAAATVRRPRRLDDEQLTPVGWAARHFPRSPTDRAVLRAVAELADRYTDTDRGKVWGQTYAKVTTIADRAGLSERACQTATRRLQRTGWLSIEERPGSTNLTRLERRTANLRAVPDLPDLPDLPDAPGPPPADPAPAPPDVRTGTGEEPDSPCGGVQKKHGRGADFAPNLGTPTGVPNVTGAMRRQFRNARDEPPPRMIATPPELAALAAALAEERLTAAYNLDSDGLAVVLAAVDRVGVPGMVRAAYRAYRRSDPVIWWSGWLRLWAGLYPPPRLVPRPPPAAAPPPPRSPETARRGAAAARAELPELLRRRRDGPPPPPAARTGWPREREP